MKHGNADGNYENLYFYSWEQMNPLKKLSNLEKATSWHFPYASNPERKPKTLKEANPQVLEVEGGSMR